MTRTEREAVVHQSWININAFLGSFKEVEQVGQVAVAGAHSVPIAILVQDVLLTDAEPTLQC